MIRVLKVLFDLSFYYAISGFYLYLFTEVFASGWGVPIFVLSACVYNAMIKWLPGIKKMSAVLACALPGLFFVFEISFLQIMQFLPAWVFFIIKIWQDRFNTDREQFADHFKVTRYTLVGAALGLIYVSRSVPAFIGVTPYLITYLMTGICLMRTLREEGSLTAGRNMALMVTVLLCSVVLAVLQAPHWIFQAAGFIYTNIILTLLRWIGYAIMMVVYAIIFVFSLIARLLAQFMTLDEFEMPGQGIGGPAEMFMEAEGMMQAEQLPWVRVVATMILIIAVALIVYFLLRRLIGGNLKAGDNNLFIEIQETLNVKERKKRSGVFRPKDPRQAIRWYYRKYLTEGASRGVKHERQDTSLSVLQKFEPIFQEIESDKLRDLYIKARYQYTNDVQKDDAQAVSELWHSLKQERKKTE